MKFLDRIFDWLNSGIAEGERMRREAYLAQSSDKSARAALEYLTKCEGTGDFADWIPQKTLKDHRRYYSLQ